MNDQRTRVKQLITRYFNQLQNGCGDCACQNSYCASSSAFLHRGLDANRAASLALDLVREQAPLCVSVDEQSSSHSMRTDNNPTPSETNIVHSPRVSMGADTVSRNTPDAPTSSGPASLSSVIAAEESERSALTASEVTRLLLFLFDSEGGDSSSTPLQRGDSHTYTRSLPHEPMDIHDHMSTSIGSASSSSSSRPPLLDPMISATSSVGVDPDSETLKDFLTSSRPNDSFTPLVSSLTTANTPTSTSSNKKRPIRSYGVDLNELKQSIDVGQNDGDWSLLTNLLSAVFGSYEALSNSFTSPNSSIASLFEPNHVETAKHEPMDIQESTEAISIGDLPSSLIHTTTDGTSMNEEVTVHPVSIADVRTAWTLIASASERQTVVDALMRAVRRLVVSDLYQLLVSQVPNGLDSNTSLTPFLRDTQQRLINLFVILYECPFTTDPLHFEHLLLNINRATTWLPINLQAKLCKVWAHSVFIPLCAVSEGDQPPEPDKTNLWALHQILLHHITLRCLTTDHEAPNEDKQICEAALVLRVVYYASLLAGQMDNKALLRAEALENREFEALVMEHSIQQPRRRQSRSTMSDPLADALTICPNDCRKPFIPAKNFVNETLNEGLRAKQDYINYRSKDPFAELSFMRLPFLLQTSSKSVLLFYDNRMRMMDEQRGAILQSLFTDNHELPYLKMHICRDRVVEDALLALEITCMENPGDLRKQLFIEFEDEQGVDEGGLSKEFFQLIIEKIFDPVYGMFVYDEQLRTYWFNPVPLDDLDREYCLIGTLLGLAIYNNIILDIRFPSVLYRKLAGKLGTYEDLKDARPDLIPGLEGLLDYDGDDFEEVMDVKFEAHYDDPFGNTLCHELAPGGSSIPITKDNRQEFVNRMADFLLNESVKKQFQAFRRGFQLVVGESPLSFLFRPDEIELLICGSQEYDFGELERVTHYADYTADSPVIKNFWQVVHKMSPDIQRQLLQFSTGSDRIPVGGMSKMKFTIARQGSDASRLPTAHTCFNILLLPDYPTIEGLEKSLLLAISYCKGFGMS